MTVSVDSSHQYKKIHFFKIFLDILKRFLRNAGVSLSIVWRISQCSRRSVNTLETRNGCGDGHSFVTYRIQNYYKNLEDMFPRLKVFRGFKSSMTRRCVIPVTSSQTTPCLFDKRCYYAKKKNNIVTQETCLQDCLVFFKRSLEKYRTILETYFLEEERVN